MKKLVIVFTVLSAFGAMVSCSNEDEVTFATIKAKAIELETLNLINDYRVSLGLNALEPHNTIKVRAQEHSMYMIEQQEISHDNFSHRLTFLMNNLPAFGVAENVAVGYTNAEDVVNAWIESEGHRNNIENQYTHFDISIEADEEGTLYFTNIFANVR